MFKIEKNDIGGNVVCTWKRRGVYRGLVVRPEGKRPFVTPRSRWEDDIKMDLNCDGKARIGMNQDRDKWQTAVNAVMNFPFP